MAGRNSNEPVINGWLAICFLMAIPAVYLFGDDIYAGVGIASGWMAQTFMSRGNSLMRWLLLPLQGPGTLGGVLYALFVALPISLLMLFLTVVFLLPLFIVFLIVTWLITGTGGQIHAVVHFVLGVGLVVLFGAFLYGIVFPLIWLGAAPIIALTFGEIVSQRLRHRVYGDRPRFAKPAYLMVALLSFGFGGVRLFVPVAEQGARAWRAEVHEVYFPPTPTPSEWPKRVEVPRKQIVHTGIEITDKSQEIAIAPSAHVFFKIGDEPKWTFVRRDLTSLEKYFSHARTGEILFYGGDEAATVAIAQPQLRGRRWLAPGETYRVGAWVDPKAAIWWCGGDDIYLRTLRDGKPSSGWLFVGARSPCVARWRAIGEAIGPPTEAPGSGFIEVKAGREPSWFNFLSVTASQQSFHIAASRLTDTGIAVRRGDRVRVAAGREAIYWLSPGSGELLISDNHYREETVTAPGTIRLKGGVVDSDATVTVIARGPDWK